jgi:hypothetical protein
VDPALRDQLAKTGLLAVIGPENIFMAQPQIGAAINEAAQAAARWLKETSGPEQREVGSG